MSGAYPLGSSPRYFPRIARIYIILLWKWLKGGSFTCIHATLFPFFFRLLNLRVGDRPHRPPPPPPGYATDDNMHGTVSHRWYENVLIPSCSRLFNISFYFLSIWQALGTTLRLGVLTNKQTNKKGGKKEKEAKKKGPHTKLTVFLVHFTICILFSFFFFFWVGGGGGVGIKLFRGYCDKVFSTRTHS